MKKAIILTVLVMLIALPAMAATGVHSTAGAKVLAPDVVKLTENVSVGVEIGKDIMVDVLHQDTKDYFEDDYGYFGYLTITYRGTLLDFSKK